MPLLVDEAGAEANSRLTAVRLAMTTLRYMESWRSRVDGYDAVMILAAVSAIVAERLTRDPGLNPEWRNLRYPVPPEHLTPCNISSIAAATGLNRETTRRKVTELIRAGLVVRSEEGAIGFEPVVLGEATTFTMIRRHLDAVVKLSNDLLRDGVVKII